jgi:hypothetical protein
MFLFSNPSLRILKMSKRWPSTMERSDVIPYSVSVSTNFGSKCRFRSLRTCVNLAVCADFLPTRCTLIFVE